MAGRNGADAGGTGRRAWETAAYPSTGRWANPVSYTHLIDSIAGPSEVLVIADESANPVFVAADMLAQAEHDERAAALCVTDSLSLARCV